jgi:endonuclease YncB( thermonuclease family)
MKKILGIIVLGLLLGGNAQAHSGRTNSEGCHNQKSNGTYHCHKPKSYSKKTSTSGVLKIVDGDTIHVGNKKYRFSGIDTPEIKQTCEKDEAIIYCGLIAKEILKEKIANQKVECVEEDLPDRYQRILAECFVNGESLSSYLVRSGYAFAYRKYSSKFIKDEEFAKDNKLGLWKTDFEYPWDYRKSK